MTHKSRKELPESETPVNLVRETYKILGYARAGSAVEQAALDGIHYAAKMGQLQLILKDLYYLISKNSLRIIIHKFGKTSAKSNY